MKLFWHIFLACQLCALGRAEVNVWVENQEGKAVVKYRCTAGETVRAFALDVTTDQGQFVSISDFFTGPCSLEAKGYGIFPASFRRYATVRSGKEATWDLAKYTPLADPADAPDDSLPGLNSAGVTLELGALWDDTDAFVAPEKEGKLCALELSEPATVTVAENEARGGVVSADPGERLEVKFSGAWVEPPAPRILGISVSGSTLAISFAGGELAKATDLDGPWVRTGNRLGQHSEQIRDVKTQFYRVQQP